MNKAYKAKPKIIKFTTFLFFFKYLGVNYFK